MAIKLGNNPKDFKRAVQIINFSGVKESITFTFLYRSKRDYAVLLQEYSEAERAKHEKEIAKLKALKAEQERREKGEDVPAADLPSITVLDDYVEWTAVEARKVLQLATAWDLTDELTLENLQQLEDEFPGSLETIQASYRSAVAEVRVKN